VWPNCCATQSGPAIWWLVSAGDEFAILLPATTPDGAEAVASKLVAGISDHVRTMQGMVGARHTSTAGLIADADRAMYDAMGAGRNRWATVHHAER